MSSLLEYILCGAVSASAAAGELLSRYRDDPRALFRSAASWVYLLVNGAVALISLLLIHRFGWDFGGSDPEQVAALQVIAASVGALAVLRSSLLTVHVGDSDVPIGPALVLDLLLGATDREIDRSQAVRRSPVIQEFARAVCFDRALLVLPAACIDLMEGLPASDQVALAARVDRIDQLETSQYSKSFLLGLALLKVVGPEVLAAAVSALRPELVERRSGTDRRADPSGGGKRAGSDRRKVAA